MAGKRRSRSIHEKTSMAAHEHGRDRSIMVMTDDEKISTHSSSSGARTKNKPAISLVAAERCSVSISSWMHRGDHATQKRCRLSRSLRISSLPDRACM